MVRENKTEGAVHYLNIISLLLIIYPNGIFYDLRDAGINRNIIKMNVRVVRNLVCFPVPLL